MNWDIRQGDWIERLKEMPDESVHCVVTSPPYWGLRDYGVPGQLGLEKTPEEYIAKMVEGFREVQRVLRSDGTLWLNMGDCYARNGGEAGGGNRELLHMEGKQQRMKRIPRGSGRWGGGNNHVAQLKEKDLVGMPWRIAFALQADGWYLRSDIVWSKPNPMPESVTDRPTKAHEYIFLLTKSAHYFYDVEAIKEPVTGNAHSRAASEYPAESLRDENRRRPGVNPKCYNGSTFTKGKTAAPHANVGQGPRQTHYIKQNPSFSGAVHYLVESRNKRSVWEIPTFPYPEAHFATFPTRLVEPCIFAGTSEKGCCPKCGAPWERITEAVDTGKRQNMADGWDTGESGKAVLANKTIAWHPTCQCGERETVPCRVLDPFGGSGTTGLVATRLHRDVILFELKPQYAEMARKRIENDSPLFNISLDTTPPGHYISQPETSTLK